MWRCCWVSNSNSRVLDFDSQISTVNLRMLNFYSRMSNYCVRISNFEIWVTNFEWQISWEEFRISNVSLQHWSVVLRHFFKCRILTSRSWISTFEHQISIFEHRTLTFVHRIANFEISTFDHRIAIFEISTIELRILSFKHGISTFEWRLSNASFGHRISTFEYRNSNVEFLIVVFRMSNIAEHASTTPTNCVCVSTKGNLINKRWMSNCVNNSSFVENQAILSNTIHTKWSSQINANDERPRRREPPTPQCKTLAKSLAVGAVVVTDRRPSY